MISEVAQISTRSATRRVLGVLTACVLLCTLPASTTYARTDPPLSPTDPSAEPLRTAREQSDRKDFTGAAATLRAALKNDPDDREMLSLLARVLAWSRRYDESIATYRKLLAKYPDSAFDRAGYARALAWSGRSDAAIPEFRRAIEQDSTNLEVRIGYARALSWSGDLAGASEEYLSVLEADPRNGDAWLGLAAVARWRNAPTASDAFVNRAASRGADTQGIEEERGEIRHALRPTLGSGWLRSRERQLTTDTTAFVLETMGQFVDGRTTLDRTVGVAVRASRLRHWEKNPGLPTDTTLNYDLRSAGFRADLSFLRRYPVQAAAGIAYQRFDARNPTVLYPLGSDEDFFGFHSRLWGYVGRISPSVGVRRDFIAIKTTEPTTGSRVLVPGGVTVADVGLRWDWNGRGSATGSFALATYTDDNERRSLGGVVAYRVTGTKPRVILDYGLTWSDFTNPSPSYFTPLESVRHAAGISATGYSERASIDYGARYEFSHLSSDNFDDIASNFWSANVGGTVLGSLPVSLEGYYSVDNHSYRTWGLSVSGSVRW